MRPVVVERTSRIPDTPVSTAVAAVVPVLVAPFATNERVAIVAPRFVEAWIARGVVRATALALEAPGREVLDVAVRNRSDIDFGFCACFRASATYEIWKSQGVDGM